MSIVPLCFVLFGSALASIVGMRVCVDAGHGGADSGAVGTDPFRIEEKNFALSLARLLGTALRSHRHRVVMTRRSDRTLGLGARARFANRLAVDVFVSIHANAAPSPVAEGIETIHFPGSAAGRRLALLVHASLMAAFPRHRNRGVKPANLAVLRQTTMPAVLVECEFLTNPRQLRFLAERANQRLLARAIATGVGQFGAAKSTPARRRRPAVNPSRAAPAGL